MTPDHDDRYYLEERYRGDSATRSGALSAYYAIKSLLPRRLQIAHAPPLREAPGASRVPTLADRAACSSTAPGSTCARRSSTGATARMPVIASWPEGKSFAVILTHDVEGPAGVANIPEVLEIERRHGFVSSWNLVAEGYPIPDDPARADPRSRL